MRKECWLRIDLGNATAYQLAFLLFALSCLMGCSAKRSSSANAASTNSSGGQSFAKVNTPHCSLITREEAAAALGGTVDVTPQDDLCAYDLTGSANKNGSLIVSIVTSASPRFKEFGVLKSDRSVMRTVSGVGDKAVIFMSKEYPGIGPKAIQVLKGDKYVAIGMSASDGRVSDDVLKSLATSAVQRLP